MESPSFLSLSSIEEEDKGLICNKTFKRNDKFHCFGINGKQKFKEEAEKWSKFKIHKDNNECIYTLIHSKLKSTEEPFGKSNRSCKLFDSRYINSATKFGEKNPTENAKFLLVIFLGYLL